MIIGLDATGQVTVFNQIAREITGYTMEELEGKNWFTVIVPKELFPSVWDEFNRLNAGGIPGTFENRILTKAGQERMISWKNSTIRDGDKITGTISFGIDITDIKKAQESLIKSEKKYRTLHDSMMDAFVISDMAGHIIEFNNSYMEMLGYSAEELFNLTYIDLTPKKWHKMEAKIVADQILPRGYSDVYEKEYVTKEGKIIPIELRTYLLKDGQGNNSGMWAIIRDISDRIKAQQEIVRLNTHLEELVEERTRQLVTSNKELESFSYSVSHDLRAPLRAIDGFSLAVMEDYGSKLDSTGLGYLKRVRDGSKNMANLIDALLQLSRISQVDIIRVRVNLTELVNNITEELQASEPNRAVTWKISPNMVVLADKVLMESIMTNLLGNAWKFTSHHPSCTIEVGRMKRGIVEIFFVRDDGAGFDMKLASKLFGAFQRMHTKNEFKGTGIGLATVQRIINKHGGRIWAESKPEAGATFYFTLKESRNKYEQ